VVFGGARLPWEKSRLQSEYILRFASPTDPKTKYEYRSIGGLAPAAITFVDGVPYVVGATVRGDAIMYYDCPDPPLIVHRHDNGKWKRAALNTIPPRLTEMNLALFSNPAMESAKAGKSATAEQISEWNKGLGKIGFGKYANVGVYKLTRLPEGQQHSDCKSVGETKMSDEWKAEYKKLRVPKITE
jgi:hypothetical protein